MADYQTIRAGRVGAQALQIDEGLKAHMNKVYGLMSVGMLITGAAAWAISGLAMSDVPTQYQIGADRYLTKSSFTDDSLITAVADLLSRAGR